MGNLGVEFLEASGLELGVVRKMLGLLEKKRKERKEGGAEVAGPSQKKRKMAPKWVPPPEVESEDGQEQGKEKEKEEK
jgi:hypothetical protein